MKNKMVVGVIVGLIFSVNCFAYGSMQDVEERATRRAHGQFHDWARRDDRRMYDTESMKEKVRHTARRAVHDELGGDKYFERQLAKEDGHDKHETEFVHYVPSWTFAANFYARHDLVQAEVTHLWATKSWSSSGRAQDVSNLVFRQEPFAVKDILLASCLLDQEVVNSKDSPPSEIEPQAEPSNPQNSSSEFNPASRNNFLSLLANKCIIFDGSIDKTQVNINYARHYYNGELSFGLQIPIVSRKNKLRLKSRLTPSEIELLKSDDPLNLATTAKDEFIELGLRTDIACNPQSNNLLEIVEPSPKFFDCYDDFEGFFNDILARKNIRPTCRDTEIGLGDVTIFLNFEVLSKHCERFILGGSVILPTSCYRDTHKLWDPESGNGGFTVLNLFSAMFWSKGRYFNPHLFLQGSLSPSTHVDRRVPVRRQFGEINPCPQDFFGKNTNKVGRAPFDEFMVFSDSILLAKPFEKCDASVRNFSTRTHRLKIRRGAEFNLRVGNILERFLLRKGYLDIFYDVRLKGKDYLGSTTCPTPFKGSVYTDNSYEVAHKVGSRYSYVFDKNWRLHGEFLYTFGGRNVLRAYEIGVALSADF